MDFIHRVNLLRRQIKQADTTMLSFGLEDPIHKQKRKPSVVNNNNPNLPENVAPGRGIQLLPIEWRKEIMFGIAADDEKDAEFLQKEMEELRESDSDEAGDEEDEVEESDFMTRKNRRRTLRDDGEWSRKVPTLSEITPEGVPQFRMLVSDVCLDVLLYMTPRYRNEMHKILTKEMNRVFSLFLTRNSKFLENGGRVSIIGHSLGSVLVFDLLCQQPDNHKYIGFEYLEKDKHNPFVSGTNLDTPQEEKSGSEDDTKTKTPNLPPLDFIVDNFFALGSPVGLFLLLKGHTLAPRDSSLTMRRRQMMRDLKNLHAQGRRKRGNAPVSRPLLHGGLYNIFFGSDAVAYRLEPLLTNMSAVTSSTHEIEGSAVAKSVLRPPAIIPYNKGGLRGIHLGMQQMGNEIANKAASAMESMRAGWRASLSIFMTKQERMELMRRERVGADSREEEAKEMDGGPGYGRLRGMNPTGRVDWRLQEGVLENEYLNGLQTHFSYLSDVDVAVFIMRECCREKLD